MKTYKIGVWEEQSGYMYVKAKSKRQAQEIALKEVEDNGMNNNPANTNLEITHREVQLV